MTDSHAFSAGAPTPTPERNAASETFLRLYATHQREVHAYIATLLRNPADVDEALQESSIIMWRKFGEFRPDGDFVRWACGIARYEVLRIGRSRKNACLPLEEAMLAQLASEHFALRPQLDARRDALQQCLERLRARDRELLEQCYERGATARQVAERLGRPVDAVYQSLHRIRRALHECIDRAIAAEERIP